ncbi:MAG: universal stress protein [Thermoplasmata archaeon]|nr:universal stress protein [Thermoplasmata archaeon]
MTGVSLKHITVAVDGSAFAQHGLDFAIDLAQKYDSEVTVLGVAPLVPLYVSSTEPWVPTEVPESEARHYRSVVEESVAKAKAAGLRGVQGVTLEGVIVDEMIAHVESHPTDLLIIGSRGLSTAKRLLLGSVSDAVSHHVKCPVLIVRGPPA